MDESTKNSSSSFKATLAKFKKFARDCAEEAFRTASNVRRSSLGSGSVHNEVMLTGNGPFTQTCQSLRNHAEDTDENKELSIIDEERENDEVISLMTNTAQSIQIIEKLQATAQSIVHLTEDAARTAEEIISSSSDRTIQTLADTSQNISTIVDEIADEVSTTKQEQIESVEAEITHVDLMDKSSIERANLIAKSALEEVTNIAGRLGEDVKNVANIVKEHVVSGSDDEEANRRLMDMIEKSDVTCTLVGDPTEDYAEACKIVCEFDEDSKVNAKRCEYACLAVNNLREEVLNTAKEISNKGEREKKHSET